MRIINVNKNISENSSFFNVTANKIVILNHFNKYLPIIHRVIIRNMFQILHDHKNMFSSSPYFYKRLSKFQDKRIRNLCDKISKGIEMMNFSKLKLRILLCSKDVSAKRKKNRFTLSVDNQISVRK